ncbi:hypothetical protein L210DRAFT_3442878 [Boletus edulis BED1]|uniref:Uncharacterized protein n=1 Tax=Boletus edulis BED1 TaxID=1328754 RepID=A0AAD4C1Y0_BOLED|nr:hypothetical protein L210DRAFT_3442878 [Boletus edulis BED1]
MGVVGPGAGDFLSASLSGKGPFNRFVEHRPWIRSSYIGLPAIGFATRGCLSSRCSSAQYDLAVRTQSPQAKVRDLDELWVVCTRE